MNDQTELEKLVSFLEMNSQFLQEYPSCSYIVPLAIDKLRKTQSAKLPEASLDSFRSYLANVWNDYTSAISTNVPVSLQLLIVAKIGELLHEFSKLIEESYVGKSHKSPAESIDKMKTAWEKSCKDLATKVQTAIWEYKRPLRVLSEHEPRYRNEMSWKNELMKLIVKYDLLNESDRPSYLLKSGYRSFFFFSSADLTYPDIWENFCKILSQFMEKKVDPFIAEILRNDAALKQMGQRYCERGLKSILEFVPVTKVNGENLGAPTLMSGLAQLGFLQRDLAPSSYFGVERLRGRKPEEEMLLVLIDDISSRGEGIGQSIDRLQNASHAKPILGVLIVDRLGDEITKIQGIPFVSMANRKELLQCRIWVPEMLLASLENPLWAGLSLFTDSVREICIFADETDEYGMLQEKFSRLLKDTLGVAEDGGKTRVVNTCLDFPRKTLEAYLTNILLISWNTLASAHFRINEPIEFLNIVLELERKGRIVLDSFSMLLFKELAKAIDNESKLFEHKDILHRVIVRKSQDLVIQIKNKYEKYQKLNMGKAFELYSDAELEELVQGAMVKSKERWKRYGCPEYYEKNEDKMRRELFEVYKGFNMALGKQHKQGN